MASKIDVLIESQNLLVRQLVSLKTALKTRNALDQENMKRECAREKAAMWERRFLIITIVVLAGVDIAKYVGVI